MSWCEIPTYRAPAAGFLKLPRQSRAFMVLALSAALLSLGSAARAQEAAAPAPAAPAEPMISADTPTVTEPAPAPTDALPAADTAASPTDPALFNDPNVGTLDEVQSILDKLLGVTVVPEGQTAGAVSKGLKPGVDTTAVAVPDRANFENMLKERYIGQHLTTASIKTLLTDILQYYSDQKLPLGDVIIPEQDIASGILIVELKEGLQQVAATTAAGSADSLATTMTEPATPRPSWEALVDNLATAMKVDDVRGMEDMVEAPDRERELTTTKANLTIIPSLKGITLFLYGIGAPEGYQGPPDSELQSGINFINIHPDVRAGLIKKLTPYLGKPTSWATLQEIRQIIWKHYQEVDRPGVDVTLPYQEVTGGTIKLAVTEARLIDVEFKGNRWYSAKRLERMLDIPYARQQMMLSGKSSTDLVKEGLPEVREKVILEEVDKINLDPFTDTFTHPFRRAKPFVTPARKPIAGATLDSDKDLTGGEFRGGETDLLVQVEEKMPFSVLGGYENTGNELTGEDRLLAGFTYYDMFHLDHRFSYFFLSANQIQDFSAHTVSYEMPFRWGKDQMHHRLSLQGSVVLSDIVPEHNDNTVPDIEGTSYLASVRYTIPFAGIYEEVDLNAKADSVVAKDSSVTNKDGSVNKDFVTSVSNDTVVPGGTALRDLVRRTFRHEMYLGYDFKRTDNAVEFGIPTALEFKTDINQFALGYLFREENIFWRGGRTTFNIEGYYNPGGLSKYDDQEHYDGSRLGAENTYGYGKVNIEREETLPANFKFRVRAAGQVSSDRLLFSEQLGLGGAYSVRGFEERILLADSGVVASAELETPRLSIGSLGAGRYDVNRLLGVDSIDRKPGLQAPDNGLSLLAFFDYGWGNVNDPLEDEVSDFSISSAGIGLRYVMAPFLTIRADYGWQLSTDGLSDSENDISGRGHIGVYVRY